MTIELSTRLGRKSRRNSTGGGGSSPSYLKASIGGSCHDVCKFGSPAFSETKPRPMPWIRPRLAEIELPTRRRYTSPPGRKRPPISEAKLKQQPWRNVGSNAILVNSSRGEVVKDVVRAPRPNVSSMQQHARVGTSKSSMEKVLRMEITNGDTRSRPDKGSIDGKASLDDKTNDDDVPEKIIHMVEPTKDEERIETGAKESRHSPDLSLQRQKTKVEVAAEQKIRRTSSCSGRLVSHEKNSPPKQLKFQETKIIEARNGNRNAGSLKRVMSSRVVNNAEPQHAKGCVFRADLRRQQVMQNRKTPGLLNIVIEETASKLVHERKSKVKALVGAFERVINNQKLELTRTTSAP